MVQDDVKIYMEKRLPSRLMKALYHLAQKYQKKGIKLFVFGSFAQLKDRKTSDLDLGVAWQKERSPQAFSELYADVLALPTIRKIDLVDTALIDEGFRTHIMGTAVFLAEETDVVHE